MKPRTDSSAPQCQSSKFGSTRDLQKTVVAKIESVEVLPITKLNNAVAAVCITILAVSWGGYAKDYLIENERLEQSRNALRMIVLMQLSGVSPMPFQKPLIEIDPSKAPLEKL